MAFSKGGYWPTVSRLNWNFEVFGLSVLQRGKPGSSEKNFQIKGENQRLTNKPTSKI